MEIEITGGLNEKSFNATAQEVLKRGYQQKDQVFNLPTGKTLIGVVRCNELNMGLAETSLFEAVVFQLAAQGFVKLLFIGYVGDDAGISYKLTPHGLHLWENKKILEQKFPLPKTDQAFVMMSFSSNPLIQDTFEGIKRSCKSIGIRPFRVDELNENRRITDLVLDSIRGCLFIIADLTEERPNVYYELGYAHALNKEVIQLCHKSSPIHFDIKDYPTIIYENRTELETRLTARIRKYKRSK